MVEKSLHTVCWDSLATGRFPAEENYFFQAVDSVNAWFVQSLIVPESPLVLKVPFHGLKSPSKSVKTRSSVQKSLKISKTTASTLMSVVLNGVSLSGQQLYLSPILLFLTHKSLTELFLACLVLPLSFAFAPPRSGELCTQKLKSHLLRTQSFKVLPLKPGVGQYIAIHTTLIARDFFFANFYLSGPFTCIFPKPLPSFSQLAQVPV